MPPTIANTVPLEIWQKIAAFLDEQQVWSLRKLNSSWFSVALDGRYSSLHVAVPLTQSRKIGLSRASKALLEHIAKYTTLQSRARRLVLRFGGESSISLWGGRGAASEPSVTRIFGLNIRYTDPNTIQSFLKSLIGVTALTVRLGPNHDKLSNTQDETSTYLKELLSTWSNIRSVDLDIPPRSIESLQVISHCQVVEVKLRVRVPLGEEDHEGMRQAQVNLARFLNRCCPLLRELSFSSGTDVVDTALWTHLSPKPNLRTLGTRYYAVWPETATLPPFLRNHSQSLRALRFILPIPLPTISPEMYHRLAAIPGLESTELPRLKTLTIEVEDEYPASSSNITLPPTLFSFISTHVVSLTCITISNWTLNVEDFSRLLGVLGNRRKLRKLSIALNGKLIEVMALDSLSMDHRYLTHLTLEMENATKIDSIITQYLLRNYTFWHLQCLIIRYRAKEKNRQAIKPYEEEYKRVIHLAFPSLTSFELAY